jgi:hypothetical protein
MSTGRAGVIDIGMFTTDMALFDQLEYVKRASDSIPVAAHDYYKALQQEIYTRYNLEYSLAQAETAARTREVTLWGRPIKLPQEMLEYCQRPLITAIREYAKDMWSDARMFDAIFVAGGAASIFTRALTETFPSARELPEAQMTNVQGFYAYAKLKERK